MAPLRPSSAAALAAALTVAAAPPPVGEVTVEVDGGRTLREVPSGMTGCHTDLGYDHQIYGYYAQRLYGESFEEFTGTGDTQPCCGNMWVASASHGVSAAFGLNRTNPLNGLVSQTISFVAGAGVAAVANRGFSEQGLYLEAGKPYEGYVFVRSAAPVTIRLALQDFLTNVTLAYVEKPYDPPDPGAWRQLNFTLTPSAGTSCGGYPVLTKPLMCKTASRPAHACVRCSGEFSVGLASPGRVDLDYAVLMPGAWGRLGELPVLKDSAERLRAGGYGAIRTGGTRIESQKDQSGSGAGFLWKHLRGPPWLRGGPMRTQGGAAEGVLVTRGWGIFEAVQMCEAMGVEPVITLNHNESEEDLADLVEYMFGGPDSRWGRLRARDGHQEPYRARWFEIGNEIKVPGFAGRATAMEERARSLGLGGRLRYICPGNYGLGIEAVTSDAARALGSQLYLDIHTAGAPGNTLILARNWTGQLRAANSSARLVVLETNTRRHDFSRVLVEGADLNDMHRYAGSEDVRVDLRVESFCMEMSGHDPGLDAKHGFLGDQGAVFFLPNQTYGQPPYYVHQMAHSSALPLVLNASCSPPCPDSLNVFAAGSRCGRKLVVRAVNVGNTALALRLRLGVAFDGEEPGENALQVSVLTSGGDLQADNPPWDPGRYAPRAAAVLAGGAAGTRIDVPAASFVVVAAESLDFAPSRGPVVLQI